MKKLPTAEMPQPVAAAAETLEQRNADLAAVEAELKAARAGIEEAKSLDRQEYAAAMDAGEPDPGARHLRAAEQHLADVERRLEGERLRVSNAECALRVALAENLEPWSGALERALTKAERASLAAVEKLAAAEQRRGELRGALGWVEGVRAGRPTSKFIATTARATRLKRNQNGDRFNVGEVLDALRQAVEDSSVEAQRRREQERREAELEAERRRAERQQWTEQSVVG